MSNSLKDFQAATTPFRAFLASHGTWTLYIKRDQQGTAIAVRTGEELIEAMRTLQRGGPYEVTLRVGQAEQGVARITKLITYKFKEESATGACIGIASYCNDGIWEQHLQESETGQ